VERAQDTAQVVQKSPEFKNILLSVLKMPQSDFE